MNISQFYELSLSFIRLYWGRITD